MVALYAILDPNVMQATQELQSLLLHVCNVFLTDRAVAIINKYAELRWLGVCVESLWSWFAFYMVRNFVEER